MSEPAVATTEDRATLQRRVVAIYSWAAGISLFAIFLLAAYAIHLGALVGPGVESSFGYAVALMMLFGALLVHLVDRAYREWPLGRKFEAAWPGPVTDQALATLLKALVFAAVAGAIAYVVWGLLQ